MTLNGKLSDYVIDTIQSIETHEIRGGPGNAVSFKMDVAPLSRVSGAPKIEDCLPSIDTNANYYIPSREIPTRYYKCCYCDVTQKEFHSNCPNCGAPMEVHEQIISKAVPISGSADSGASYGMAATFSSGMYELS